MLGARLTLKPCLSRNLTAFGRELVDVAALEGAIILIVPPFLSLGGLTVGSYMVVIGPVKDLTLGTRVSLLFYCCQVC